MWRENETQCLKDLPTKRTAVLNVLLLCRIHSVQVFSYNDFFLDYYLSRTQILNAPCYANMSSDRTHCTMMRRLSYLCGTTN